MKINNRAKFQLNIQLLNNTTTTIINNYDNKKQADKRQPLTSFAHTRIMRQK